MKSQRTHRQIALDIWKEERGDWWSWIDGDYRPSRELLVDIITKALDEVAQRRETNARKPRTKK